MTPRVYIQANAKQLFCARISAYSMKRKATRPLEVKILELESYPQLTKHEGQLYKRKHLDEIWLNDTLQSFTPLRFLPPQEQGFQGRALVVDPDVFALVDVCDLLYSDMKDKAILCNYDEGPDGLSYKTSVMLLDCEKLKHWQWDLQIEKLFSKKISYRDWMSLKLEDPKNIGYLAPEWNHLDTLTENTKMIHYTKKITQPWKTGLTVDFIPDKLPPKWGFVPRSLTVGLKSLVFGGFWKEKASKIYLDNPNKDQVKLFWQYVAEAYKDGVFSIDEARIQEKAGNIRPDFVESFMKHA